jgi:chloramphenicol 3-O phosphotransferase
MMGEKHGTIVILDGVSSAGKTTMARALQDHMDEPFFWITNDTFCDMCPSKFWDRDWATAINQSLIAMIHTVRTFSDLGLNTIVDQVFLQNDTEGQLLEKCIEVLGCHFEYLTEAALAQIELQFEAERKRRLGLERLIATIRPPVG